MTYGMVPKANSFLNANNMSLLLMNWHIPQFREKIISSNLGLWFKSCNFMYSTVGWQYLYLLSLRLYLQGTVKDPLYNYVSFKNECTLKDSQLKLQIPVEFVVEIANANKSRCLSIVHRNREQCDIVYRGVLGIKEKICGYLKLNLRVNIKRK